MKIAYVTTYDSSDRGKWSGLGYYFAQALRRRIEIVRTGKHYEVECTPRVVKSYADQVSRQLEGLAVDAVFSPGSIPI